MSGEISRFVLSGFIDSVTSLLTSKSYRGSLENIAEKIGAIDEAIFFIYKHLGSPLCQLESLPERLSLTFHQRDREIRSESVSWLLQMP